MEEETTFESDPLYSREAVNDLKHKGEPDTRGKKDPPKLKINLTGVKKECAYCANKHNLEDSQKIMKLAIADRNKISSFRTCKKKHSTWICQEKTR